VDLEIASGEIVALVGPSGAGKTSLLRLMAGSLLADRGTACFEGQDLARLRPAALRAVRSRIGFVHQDHSLVPIFRAHQNVIAGALGQRGFWAAARSMIRPTRADLDRAHRLLGRVGIPEELCLRTDYLSGGQQQRVAIARALFQAPHALLADEPVASVDPTRARAVLTLMKEVADERGLTLVASLHDIRLARDLFPRLVGLRAGRVAFDAPTDQVDDDDLEALYRLDGPAPSEDG
jgi:phosphonate transport system ATP-binding protein